MSVHSFTNVWFGGGTEYSLTLTETDDISTGMFMVYGSQYCLVDIFYEPMDKHNLNA